MYDANVILGIILSQKFLAKASVVQKIIQSDLGAIDLLRVLIISNIIVM